MKPRSFIYLAGLCITSCISPYTEIGSLDLLTDREIDSTANYERLFIGRGGSKKELKQSKAVTIEQAIDSTLNSVPGGIYLTDVKIYSIRNNYLAVSGDVWGKVNHFQTAYAGLPVKMPLKTVHESAKPDSIRRTVTKNENTR